MNDYQMSQTSFYSEEELLNIGFKSIGKKVLISRFARFYHPERISIGNHVRIDDFCIFSAGSSIVLGNYIHIACYASFIGEGEIILEDYCSISGRVSIYSSSDDYLGIAMTNPMIPSQFTYVKNAPVYLHKHSIVGCGSVILPGITLYEGASVGAMSLVNKDCEAESVFSGVPAKKVSKRLQRYHKVEKMFEEWRIAND